MRKIVSLLLAAVLAIGMTATVFAAPNPKITTQSKALADVYVGDAVPGQKIFLPFVKEAFDGATEDLKASDVRSSNITVKHTVKSGPKAIESVEIKEHTDSSNNKVAGVLITLVDPFTSTKPLDFELSVYLYINGKRQSVGTYVEGTLSNVQQYVDSGTDYIDLSDGSVAICEQNATKVETYLGEGVTMFAKMVKGKSYAGIATSDPTNDDIDMFDQYPDIVNVYTLIVDGLTGSGKIVQIDSEQNLYVYDGNLNYLGRTNELLAFSEKYYVAEKKLDVVESEPEAEWEEEPEDDGTGYLGENEGDSDSEPTPTDVSANGGLPAVAPARGGNPDTGIPSLFGISLTAGMLALAAMGAVSIKKRK